LTFRGLSPWGSLESSAHDKALSPGAVFYVRPFLVGAAGAFSVRGVGTAGAAAVELDTITRPGDAVTFTRAGGAAAVATETGSRAWRARARSGAEARPYGRRG